MTYIPYINVGCYYKYSSMLSHIALYNVTTNTKNIRTVVCANTKGHLLGTSLTWNLTIPNLILDPPLTRNLTIPCLFYVKNVFHRASSKVIIKNFSQQVSRKCKIKLRASFTKHFCERGGWELRLYPSLSLNLRRLETLDARFSYNFKQPNLCRKKSYPGGESESKG